MDVELGLGRRSTRDPRGMSVMTVGSEEDAYCERRRGISFGLLDPAHEVREGWIHRSWSYTKVGSFRI